MSLRIAFFSLMVSLALVLQTVPAFVSPKLAAPAVIAVASAIQTCPMCKAGMPCHCPCCSGKNAGKSCNCTLAPAPKGQVIAALPTAKARPADLSEAPMPTRLWVDFTVGGETAPHFVPRSLYRPPRSA